eukprot:TRINITY_DN5429_c0_g1_i2.p1 TRINITY_DN5429_c0_g1~~TRINITY_DN5429_c0_g1_i2.p1  ORF type:complete len:205 (+),score=19.50 TRINITY_DN5429_c0_g1_i2:85-699(+)
MCIRDSYKAMEGQPFKLVPIMVGHLGPEAHASYAKILAKYFDQDDTAFVISSDFCHWGKRFRFEWYKETDGQIYESIEKLDRTGMSLIESQDAGGFYKYLQETKNTICGRNPISVLLNIIANSAQQARLRTKFVRYAQSSQVMDSGDSSVSYASSVTYLDQHQHALTFYAYYPFSSSFRSIRPQSKTFKQTCLLYTSPSPRDQA